MEGWIKSYRSVMDNPIVCKDADHYAVWGYIMHYAAHADTEAYFAGKRITLKAGQLITGRKKIAEKFRVNEIKIYRVLKCFESEQQIEQRTTNACTLITVINWSKYQPSEQQIAQPLNNNCTTTAQRLNTIQECKNERNNNSLSHAHAHEDDIQQTSHPLSDPQENLPPVPAAPLPGGSDFIADLHIITNELQKQSIWLEQVAMQRGLKNTQQARTWLETFLGELRIRGDTLKSVNDTKSHFVSWLKVQLDKQKQQSFKTPTNGSIPKRLAGSDFD